MCNVGWRAGSESCRIRIGEMVGASERERTAPAKAGPLGCSLDDVMGLDADDALIPFLSALVAGSSSADVVAAHPPLLPFNSSFNLPSGKS